MLSDLEKSILFHKHEANRCRFFGHKAGVAYNMFMATALQRLIDYSERTRDGYVQTLRKRLQG
ncbi:hypothetical protein APT65_00038 [Trabzonvirus APT65]|uniref:Uncharacterized protein n=1 Tax=Aeromonas phage APT65 TaxID=2982914 RepID=A0A9E8GAP1_9CAUD|nr:hypothetical protein APT65_00038 [Aeromonas phage APT65]